MLMLENLPPEDTENYNSALEIYRASLRARELTERLSTFSRKQGTRRAHRTQVEMLVQNALTIAAPVQPKNVEVHHTVSCPNPLWCEETQMAQVLLNLIINGFQAMTPEGGTLTLSAEEADGWATFRVADTGCGIAPQELKKIFDPFYTSKGAGTGLGLPIVRQIVEEYGGTVDVESSNGTGTCFTVTLPLQQPPEEDVSTD